MYCAVLYQYWTVSCMIESFWVSSDTYCRLVGPQAHGPQNDEEHPVYERFIGITSPTFNGCFREGAVTGACPTYVIDPGAVKHGFPAPRPQAATFQEQPL